MKNAANAKETTMKVNDELATAMDEQVKAIAYLTRQLERTIESGKATVETFKAKLDEDPIYAFEWSQGHIEEQAKARVATIVLAWFNAGKSVAEIKDATLRQALNGAKFPSFSTSQPTNLVKTCLTAAWSNMVETLDYLEAK